MMTRLLSLIVVLVVLLSGSAAARQSVTITIPFFAWGYGPVESFSVDTDGDPNTYELALFQWSQAPWWRVVALRNGAWCHGEPIIINVSPMGDQGMIQRVGTTDWIRWQDPGGDFARYTKLDTPTCPPDARVK